MVFNVQCFCHGELLVSTCYYTPHSEHEQNNCKVVLLAVVVLCQLHDREGEDPLQMCGMARLPDVGYREQLHNRKKNVIIRFLTLKMVNSAQQFSPLPIACDTL